MIKGFTTKNNGALWIQPDGPNTKVYYLGCHDLSDITVGKGSKELQQCFKSDGSGWQVISATEKPPEMIKFSIEVAMGKAADKLEQIACPSTVYITQRDCGLADVFVNRVRALMLRQVAVTSEKYTDLVSAGEDKPSKMGFEFEAWPPMGKAWSPVAGRQVTSEARALTSIAKAGGGQCASACGPASNNCDTLFATSEADGGAADVLVSYDGGGTWTITAGKPFAAAEHIAALVTVNTGNNWRVIVVRGTTDAGNPAEIAYSDDDGATWTNVDVGTVDGTYATTNNSLFALDYEHIWLVLTDGYIFFSEDAGVTWTSQADAITEDLNCVYFMSDGEHGVVGGVNNSIATTVDGGTTWSVTTGPASEAGNDVLEVAVQSEYMFWAVYDSGGVHYTNDYGDTWGARALVGVTATRVDDLKFVDDLCGWMIATDSTYLTAYSIILRTIDGGYSWEIVDSITNDGLVALLACDCNTAYAVGDLVSGTAVIGKFAA